MGRKKVVTSEMNSLTPVLVISSQTMFTLVPLNNIHVYVYVYVCIYICMYIHERELVNDLLHGEGRYVCMYIRLYVYTYMLRPN